MDAGKIIKHCRKSAGLTQKELEERIFVSVTTIGNYESECRDAPYVEKVREALSADRPQGEVDAVEIYERAEHNLEQGYITIGEFDKRIEPLRHLCYGRPQGEWIGCRHEDSEWLSPMADFYKCSICGKIVNLLQMRSYKFCPNCGARMKGADDADE